MALVDGVSDVNRSLRRPSSLVSWMGEKMNVVALVTQKGGAGKSTLASNLAVSAFLRGERVFICDLDPQQSLVKWSKARKALDIPVEHIPPGKLTRALDLLERDGVTLAIVDTPGGATAAAAEAVDAADFCILPARPNVLDLWASEDTLARVKDRRKDFAFLLTQCPPAQQSIRVARGLSGGDSPWLGGLRVETLQRGVARDDGIMGLPRNPSRGPRKARAGTILSHRFLSGVF